MIKLARMINEIRHYFGIRGRHRSLGMSTSDWVEMLRVSRAH